MGTGKSVSAKSHRLSYGKPRQSDEPLSAPQAATLVDPVSYVRFWDKYNHGEPVDISKAKKMTRDDLLKADPRGIELMLAYGVTQKQIAMQYNTPTGSLAVIFKRLGVNTKVESVVVNEAEAPEPVATEPQTDVTPELSPEVIITDELPDLIGELTGTPDHEFITDPAQIAEFMVEPSYDTSPNPIYQEFQWFYGTPRPGTIPILTVRNDGRLDLPMAIRSQYTGTRIRIGITSDSGCLVVGATDIDDKGIRTSIKQAKVRCIEIGNELTRRGINLPVKYEMAWNEPEQFWAGTLIEP